LFYNSHKSDIKLVLKEDQVKESLSLYAALLLVLTLYKVSLWRTAIVLVTKLVFASLPLSLSILLTNIQ